MQGRFPVGVEAVGVGHGCCCHDLLAGEAVDGRKNSECTERPQRAHEQAVVEIDIGPNTSSREHKTKIEIEQIEEL